jgi:hypothetical protein
VVFDYRLLSLSPPAEIYKNRSVDMLRLLLSIVLVLVFAPSFRAQSAPDTLALTSLLNDFLRGASRNDAAMHERFWAEELIYTGASGRRVGKADIMNDIRSSPTPRGGERTTYTAEDIRIRQYGNTALVAFRLVAKVEKGNKTEISHFHNTGTFLKRDGKWQAIGWQATRLPRAEADVKKDLAAAEDSLQKATLAGDINVLEAVLDESFIWTQRNGEQLTRQQLLDQLRLGQLKYSQLTTSNVAISLSGDTGIIRGTTARQRSAIPGSTGTGDAAPFTAFYTLVFANKGGSWKAVAMHTSRQ